MNLFGCGSGGGGGGGGGGASGGGSGCDGGGVVGVVDAPRALLPHRRRLAAIW